MGLIWRSNLLMHSSSAKGLVFLSGCLCAGLMGLLVPGRAQADRQESITNAKALAIKAPTARPTFRLTLNQELGHLDPVDAHNSLSSYLLNSLHVGLMRYQNQKLEPYGARSCAAKGPRHFQCVLREEWRWSDGRKVLASHFVENWKFMKQNSSLRMDDFRVLRSVEASSPLTVEFYLREDDSEFLYRLIDVAMLPRRSEASSVEAFKKGELTTGVFYVNKYNPGRSYELAPNPFFFLKNVHRPNVEFLLVDSDHTTLSLFEARQINFVRRLTADQSVEYKNNPGFRTIPLHRMDYIGFGKEVADRPLLAEKLIFSLQSAFLDFQKIFQSDTPPGCFSLRAPEIRQPVCYPGRKWQPEVLPEALRPNQRLKLIYATQAGEDIRRSMELFQNAWKKNLGLTVDLESREWAVLNAQLQKDPPALFRRGSPLFRPTCLAALELFASKSPSNWVQLRSKALDEIILQLKRKSDPNLCQKGLNLILNAHRIIPLGAIHFSVLSDNKFDGILINELNQLDLSRLSPKE